MRRERHGLALGPDGACVLCRGERPPGTKPPGSVRTRLFLAALLVVAGGGAALWRYALASPADLALFAPGTTGVLATRNAAGRSGAYFLPTGYRERPLPLLVAIHGTNSSGAAMVATFREAAEREKFFIVAPDSRRGADGKDSWEVGDHAGEITPDFQHVNACVAELLAMPGVRIDPAHVLIAGHSGGGSTAPYVATNAEPYTAFAVLHGGVFSGGLGRRSVRGWFSTGQTDGMRPPAAVQEAANRARAGGVEVVEYRTYSGGHEVTQQELRDVLNWWLGR